MNTEIYVFKVGSFQCIAVSDGIFAYPDHTFFVNAPKERLGKVLRQHNIEPGQIIAPWTCLFINTGQNRVLVDTGGGRGLAPGVGNLLPNLRAAGIQPVEIDTVILTHGHPDHIGGNTDADGKPAFPTARHVMWKKEWEFWTSGPDLEELEVETNLKELMLALARKNLPPVQDQLDLVDRETEIVPGIQAIAAPGHTPGHMALTISSSDEGLVSIADAVLHPIHLEQPDWRPAFDLAGEQAMATRRRFLDWLAAEKALVIASHFPFPGLGHVIRKGEGWHWEPLETTR